MDYKLLTDDEIMQDLAEKFDLLRRSKEIKDETLAAKGGTNRMQISRFRNGQGGISLKTFIRILRGMDELDRLEDLLKVDMDYHPSGKASSIPRKRVRNSVSDASAFTWGEDK